MGFFSWLVQKIMCLWYLNSGSYLEEVWQARWFARLTEEVCFVGIEAGQRVSGVRVRRAPDRHPAGEPHAVPARRATGHRGAAAAAAEISASLPVQLPGRRGRGPAPQVGPRGQAVPLGLPLTRGGRPDHLSGLPSVHPLEFCASPSGLTFDFFPPKSSLVEPRKMKVIISA